MKNYFIKLRFLFLIILFVGVFGLAKVSWAATLTAANCSQAEVQSKITAAARGDTVNIPAGSCTWTSGVNIPRAMTIRGAGNTVTIIKGAGASSSNQWRLFFYSPGDNDDGHIFRVTQIGFDFENQSYLAGIVMSSNASVGKAPGYRIDNNRFTNIKYPSGKYQTGGGHTINYYGLLRGVTENNYFQGNPILLFSRWGGAWNKTNPIITTWNVGRSDDHFVEDNYFEKAAGYYQVLVTGSGGSWVARYNTFDYIAQAGGYCYTSDNHGLQCMTVDYSMAGVSSEYFGNYIIGNCDLSSTRASINKIFYNKSLTSSSGARGALEFWETYGSTRPNCKTSTSACPGGSTYQRPLGSLYYGLTHGCSVDGRSMNVERTHAWNNKYATSKSANGTEIDYKVNIGGCNDPTQTCPTDSPDYPNCTCPSGYTGCACTYPNPSEHNARALRLNGEIWIPNGYYSTTNSADCNSSGGACFPIGTRYRYSATPSSYTETKGVRCGTQAQRSAVQNPALGDAFWQTTQDCSYVKDTLFGVGHTENITGTLYLYNGSTWVAEYTPYTYPHPFRGGASSNTAPLAPTGVRVV